MARPSSDDYLQGHRFWLVDVAPSMNPPFFVLGGVGAAFSSVSMPELTLEYQEIKQINSLWSQRALVDGGVGQVSLSRGAIGTDGTFYRWLRNAADGFDVSARTLLLMQYGRERMASVVAGLSPSGFVGSALMPKRMWLLVDCLPIRYKAGGDFSGSEGTVSLMELDLQPTGMVELTLADMLLQAARKQGGQLIGGLGLGG